MCECLSGPKCRHLFHSLVARNKERPAVFTGLTLRHLRFCFVNNGGTKRFVLFACTTPLLMPIHKQHSPNCWLLANEKTVVSNINQHNGSIKVTQTAGTFNRFPSSQSKKSPLQRKKNNHSLNNSSFLVVHCNSYMYDKIMVDTLYLRSTSDCRCTFSH